jgi:hypothetical protein
MQPNEASGLELVGSRPPSRLDSRPPTHRLTTSRLKPASGSSTPINNNQVPRQSSSGWLDERSRGQSHRRPLTEGSTLTENGAHISETSSSRSVTSDRPPSGLDSGSRQSAASRLRSSKHHERHSVASYVDESLFGSPLPQPANFKAPWQSSTKRPSSVTTRQPSYIDNSLFGDQLEPTSWRAPWQEKTSTRKPLVFDAFDYRLTIEHDNVKTVKEPNSLLRTKSIASLENKKRPWR